MLWRQPGAVRVLISVPQFASEEYPEIWMPASDIPYWSATNAQQGEHIVRLIEDARGWPLLAMVCRFEDLDGYGHRFVARGGLELATAGPGQPRALPIVPIWRGFLANTMLYAALLWLLFFAPFTLRRHLRARRGLCPACAYPVGELSVCSECGRAVNARSTIATAE